jgi:hypothetical protein
MKEKIFFGLILLEIVLGLKWWYVPLPPKIPHDYRVHVLGNNGDTIYVDAFGNEIRIPAISVAAPTARPGDTGYQVWCSINLQCLTKNVRKCVDGKMVEKAEDHCDYY